MTKSIIFIKLTLKSLKLIVLCINEIVLNSENSAIVSLYSDDTKIAMQIKDLSDCIGLQEN